MSCIVGRVKFFKLREGWGFIEAPPGQPDVFIHYSHIIGEGYKKVKAGQFVEYDLIETDKGPLAENVLPLDSDSVQ